MPESETDSESQPRIEDIAGKTVRSSVWQFGRHFLTTIVNIVVMAILARKLGPAEFGLVTLALVIVRFTSLIGAGGVGTYVIYDRAEGREERVHAAFWLNTLGALVMLATGFAALPFIVTFYGMPDLYGIVAACLCVFFVTQLCSIPEALIRRTLDLRRIAIRDGLLELGSSCLAVGMALSGYGAWSLVLPGLLLSPISLFVSFQFARWLPRLPFGTQHWRTIFRYSGNAIIAETANSVGAEGDTLLIGKTLGANLLGIYNMAWTTANIVSRNVSGVVGKIAMPALNAAAGDHVRLRQGVKRMMRVLAIASFPLLVGLFVLAEEFILTLYGPKWHSSVLPLRILIIFAMRRAVGAPVTAIYDVLGRPDLGMKLAVVFIPFYLGSIWLGSFYGIVGVAAAVSIARTLHGFLQFEVAARLLREPMLDLLKPLLPALLSSTLMGLVVYLMKVSLMRLIHLPAPASLGILVAVGAATYFILLRTIFQNVARDVVALVPETNQAVRMRLGKLFAIS